MDNTGSEICWSEIYGRQHGTAFFYNGEIADNFLTHMEVQMKDKFDSYFRGFAEGIMGKYKRRYRYMKEPEKEEPGYETQT